MYKIEFINYLKKKGKKSHVIDNLVNMVELYQKYLHTHNKTDIDKVTANNLNSYIEFIESKDSCNTAKKHCRGIALYYRFSGKDMLADIASDYRQKAISDTKKPFALKNLIGINREYITKIEKLGISNIDQMLAAGRTKTLRKQLADKTGIPLENIIELVKLSDLSRIRGIKAIRSRLYYDAGIDTIAKMARQDPKKLRQHLIDFVEKTGFAGIAPLPKEIDFTISEAKKLEQIVDM
jgi:site-specific recombinase XerD